MAFEVFKMMGTVALDTDPALQGLKAIQDQAQKTATAAGGSFAKFSGFIEKNSAAIKKVGKTMTVAGGAIIGILGLIINQTVNAGDAFNDMSLRTGVSVEALSALDYAAKQSGTNIEAVELSLKFLTRAMDDTSKGIGTAKDTFAALGVSVTDTNGKLRPTVDVMKDIATKIAAIDDPVRQAAIAMELFGARSGTELVPLLKLGGAGIDALMKKAKELGIVFSTEAAQSADEFKDTLTDLKLSLGAVGKDISSVLIPPLLEYAKKAIEIAKDVREWMKANELLTGTIVKWVAGLGGLMLILGPLTMALPSLVAGFRLWGVATVFLSEKFAAFALTLGLTAPQLLLVAGAIAFVTKVTYGWIDAIEESKKIEVEENVSIDAKGAALLKLQKAYHMTGTELAEYIKTGKISAEIRARVTQKTQEDTVATDKNTAAIEKNKDTLLTASEKVEAQIASITAEYELSNKTTADTAKYTSDLTKAYKELIEKLKQEQKAHKEGTVEYQNYTAAIYAAELKIKDLTKATGTLMTYSQLLEADIANVTAEYELSNKTTEDTAKYYSTLIQKYNELISKLKQEQSAHKEGTVEYQNYTAAIHDAELKIKELDAAQHLALTGLELTTSELGILENKYSDVTKDEEYFTEKAKLLKETYDELNAKLKETEFHSPEWFDLSNKLLDTEEAARGLKEQYEELNSIKLAESLDLVDARLTLLDATFADGVKTVDYYQQKIGLLTEKHVLLLQQLEDLEARNKGNTAEWFNVKTAIVSVEGEITNLNDALYASQHIWETFFKELKAKYSDTIGALQTGITNFVSTFESALSDAIYSLFTMASTNAQIQDEMAQAEEDRLTETTQANEDYKQALIAQLSEYVDAKTLSNATIAELETMLKDFSYEQWVTLSTNAQDQIQAISDKYDELTAGLEEKQVTVGSILKTLWETLVDAILKELARIAAYYIVSWLFGIFLGEGGGIGYKLGGKINAYDIGGRIRRMQQAQAKMEYFQAGGPKGTDTVPIWATPGEYMISKPMTDFIRRTGAITGNLIRSIQTGSRTPAPGFAGGGMIAAGAGGYGSIELNILPGAIMINTKTLDDRAISQAGTKLYAEMERQARNAGKIFVGR